MSEDEVKELAEAINTAVGKFFKSHEYDKTVLCSAVGLFLFSAGSAHVIGSLRRNSEEKTKA